MVFQKRQVLPRYIIYYSRSGSGSSLSPWATASSNPRFEQVDAASHAHAPLTILWVDQSYAEGEAIRKMLQSAGSATREVVCFVSSDELKVRSTRGVVAF